MNKQGPKDRDPRTVLIGLDLRPVETQHAISALRKYLDVMERQMLVVQSHEIAAFEAERPLGDSEDQQSIYFAELNNRLGLIGIKVGEMGFPELATHCQNMYNLLQPRFKAGDYYPDSVP